MDHWMRQAGLQQWCTETPSIRLGTSDSSLSYFHHIFSTDHHLRMLNLRRERKCRKLKFGTYISKQKTLMAIGKEIIGDRDPAHVVVSFGNASYNHASRGYAPAPRQKPFIRSLRQLGTTVIEQNEFNTSQVCSTCHDWRRLGSPGTHLNVDHPHFIRRCKSNECGKVWNRDVNAARNMRDLGRIQYYNFPRPALFSTVLPHDDDE